MRKPIVPRFEPEVVKAEANKNRFGDDEKVATTSFTSVEVEGVFLYSRYNKAHEFDSMAGMVRSVDVHLRSLIESIFCDSKAHASYSVNLKPCSKKEALEIADQLNKDCQNNDFGHNGIYVEGANGGQLFVDPHWVGDIE